MGIGDAASAPPVPHPGPVQPKPWAEAVDAEAANAAVVKTAIRVNRGLNISATPSTGFPRVSTQGVTGKVTPLGHWTFPTPNSPGLPAREAVSIWTVSVDWIASVTWQRRQRGQLRD